MVNSHRRNLSLLLIAAVALLSFGWVGYIASDDDFYAHAAVGWLDQFPYVGHNHWSMRHPYVLATAASFALFGVSEHALTLVVMGFFLSSVALAYAAVAARFGPNPALWVGLLLLSTPLFAVTASIPGADLPQMFFIILSVLLFQRGLSRESSGLFFAAGVAAGLGWLTRETTGALVVFYGLLFLFAVGGNRMRYWVMAAGFVLPVAAEMLWLWYETGDLVYRYNLSANLRGQNQSADYIKPQTGNIETECCYKVLNPLLAIFINQEFMLLFFVFIPAAIWSARSSALSAVQRHSLLLLCGLTVTWFLVVGYLMPVRDLPRYYAVSAFTAATVVALWLGVGLWPRWPRLAGLLAVALVGTNLFGIYVENKQPVFGERALAAWLQDHDATLYTDPKTYYSSRFLLTQAGVLDRAAHGLPPPGGLYLYNPNRVLQSTRPPGYADRYKPPPNWPVVDRIPAERKLSGYLLDWLGLSEQLPGWLVSRLDRPVEGVTIVQHRPG